MKTFRLMGTLVLALLLSTSALAALDVVASSSSTGALVRQIMGNQADLTILAPPDRDLHHLQAKPSMIRALRGADLVVATGADLEIGWLPLAINQSANPKIQPGSPGYFEAAAQVKLLEVGGPADRALGDVHPTGNPHISMDPVRMSQVAKQLAERLALLDPPQAQLYRANANEFARSVDQRMPAWTEQLSQLAGVVSFHKDLIYLLDRFGVAYWGSLEPVPGVPPTGAHLSKLVEELQGKTGVIAFTSYQPAQAPASLAKTLGWRQVRLPLEPPLDADGAAYLAHMQQWLDALAPTSP